MTLLRAPCSARLVLTFVSGLIVDQVLVTLVGADVPEREAFVFRISAERAAHRLADLLKLMDQLPPRKPRHAGSRSRASRGAR